MSSSPIFKSSKNLANAEKEMKETLFNQFENQFIEIDGKKIRYWSQGQGDKTIFYIHGLGGSVENWAKNIDFFQTDYRVVALDLIGYGLSSHDYQAVDARSQAEIIAKFVRTLDLKNIYLVGHSLGGAISILLTLQHPGLFQQLILVASAGFGDDIAFLLRILTVPLIGELLTLTHSQQTVRKGYENIVFNNKSIDDDFVEMAFNLPRAKKSVLKTLRNDANFFGLKEKSHKEFRDQLSHLTLPVSIIWGKQDTVTPVSHAFTAKNSFTNATLTLLDKCGHFIQYEHPSKFNEFMLGILLA